MNIQIKEIAKVSKFLQQCLYKSLETKDTHTIGLALLNQKSPIRNPKSEIIFSQTLRS